MLPVGSSLESNGADEPLPASPWTSQGPAQRAGKGKEFTMNSNAHTPFTSARGGDEIPAGTFHGGDEIPAGTFHR